MPWCSVEVPILQNFSAFGEEQFCNKIAVIAGRQPSLALSRTATNRPAKWGLVNASAKKKFAGMPVAAPPAPSLPGSAWERTPAPARVVPACFSVISKPPRTEVTPADVSFGIETLSRDRKGGGHRGLGCRSLRSRLSETSWFAGQRNGGVRACTASAEPRPLGMALMASLKSASG